MVKNLAFQDTLSNKLNNRTEKNVYTYLLTEVVDPAIVRLALDMSILMALTTVKSRARTNRIGFEGKIPSKN